MMYDEHDGHDLRAASAWGDGARWGFVVCGTCRVILHDVPLCGKPTQRGTPCVWVCSPFAQDRAEHPHQGARAGQTTPAQKKKQPSAEMTWLERLYRDHGEHVDGTVALRRLRRGLAVLLEERYGGHAECASNGAWEWSCVGVEAEKVLAALRVPE